MPLNHKSAAVREMRELLKNMLTDPDFEHKTCERIDVIDLLDAARRYNPDRIGIEVVEIALNALCTQLCAVCTNNTYNLLRMRKISYAGEHTMMSTYAWFKDSKVAQRYPFGHVRNCTGARHTQAPDGVWVLELYNKQHCVHSWLLNVEVDGDGKEAKGEFQSLCNKMWQAVDFQRVCRPNATTFTLRTNMTRMQSSHAKLSQENMDVDALRRALVEAEQNQSRSTQVLTSIENATERDSKFVHLFSELMRNFTNAHVHFMCTMLRTICCTGSLYDAMYTSGVHDPEQHIFDVHAFLGAFSIDEVHSIKLTAPLFGGDWTAPAGGGLPEYDRRDKKDMPICTVPSVFGTVTGVTVRNAVWSAWGADIINYRSLENAVAPQCAVQFICVQRVNMPMALQKERMAHAKAARAAVGGGGGVAQPGLLSPYDVWRGVWYAADIIAFLDNIVLLGLAATVTNENIRDHLLHYGLVFNNDTLAGPWQAWQQPVGAAAGGAAHFNNTKKFYYCIKSNQHSTSQGVKNADLFRYAKGNDAFFTTGELWVVHSMVDEMVNAMLNMWWRDVDSNSIDTAVSFADKARISWNSNTSNDTTTSGDNYDSQDIALKKLLDTIKRIHQDFAINVLTRKACTPHADFERMANGAVLSMKNKGTSLRSCCVRSMATMLPDLDEQLSLYVKKFNCPDFHVFLQIVRCTNLLALRDLRNTILQFEDIRTQFYRLLAQFPQGVQSEVLHAIDFASTDAHILDDLQQLKPRSFVQKTKFDRMRARSQKWQQKMESLAFNIPVELFDLLWDGSGAAAVPIFNLFTEFAAPLMMAAQGIQSSASLEYTPVVCDEETMPQNWNPDYTLAFNGWMLQHTRSNDQDAWPFRMVYDMLLSHHSMAERMARSVLENTAEEHVIAWVWKHRFLTKGADNPAPVLSFGTNDINALSDWVRIRVSSSYDLRTSFDNHTHVMVRTHERFMFKPSAAGNNIKLWRGEHNIMEEVAIDDIGAEQTLHSCFVVSDMFFLHSIDAARTLLTVRAYSVNEAGGVTRHTKYCTYEVPADYTITEVKWAQDYAGLYILCQKHDHGLTELLVFGALGYEHISNEDSLDTVFREEQQIASLNGPQLQLSHMHILEQGQYLVFKIHHAVLFRILVLHRFNGNPSFINAEHISSNAKILSCVAYLQGTDPRILVYCQEPDHIRIACLIFFLNDERKRQVHALLPADMQNAAACHMAGAELRTLHTVVGQTEQRMHRAIVSIDALDDDSSLRIVQVLPNTVTTVNGGVCCTELYAALDTRAAGVSETDAYVRAARRVDARAVDADNAPTDVAWWPYWHAHHSTSTVFPRLWGWMIMPRIVARGHSSCMQLCMSKDAEYMDVPDAGAGEAGAGPELNKEYEIAGLDADPAMHWLWQMRRSLQQYAQHDIMWSESPEHAAVEYATLAASSWLALARQGPLRYGDGCLHSECWCRDDERAGLAAQNPVVLLCEHYRPTKLPCPLARGLWHNSLDEEEAGDMAKKYADDLPHHDDSSKQAEHEAVLGMPMLWDCVAGHAWYMRELVHAAFVCWRTADDRRVAVVARREQWAQYTTARTNLTTNLTTEAFRKTAADDSLLWKGGVARQIMHDSMALCEQYHPLQIKLQGRSEREVERELKRSSSLNPKPHLPKNILDAIWKRRLNHVMVAVKIRSVLYTAQYGAPSTDKQHSQAFFERRCAAAVARLRAASRWKRLLLVVNMQARLHLHTLRSSIVTIHQQQTQSACNDVWGNQVLTHHRTIHAQAENLANDPERGIEMPDVAQRQNIMSWKGIDPAKFSDLLRPLFRSLQAQTIAAGVVLSSKIRWNIDNINDPLQELFARICDQSFEFITSASWRAAFARNIVRGVPQ